ncbi:hypothetical protein PENTCL1PPCAC_29802, partial [Pristionchus entomophagus]
QEVPWLLLENGGNDCFLNAALQYLRRARDLRGALESRVKPDNLTVDQEKKECVLRMLGYMLSRTGRVHPKTFRHSLPTVIRGLEPAFLTTQQDAYEILTKIFDDVIPEEIARHFFIESSSRRRCKDQMDCQGREQVQSGAIHYQHIGHQNQVLDLEALLSDEWAVVDGENEPRHCSACCECCLAAEYDHEYDKCEICKALKRPYVEEQRFRFIGDSRYALVAFNILHANQRVDWALAPNCDMDGMKLMGRRWKAVAVIKHIGHASFFAGHYVSYTREDDGRWWLHNDDALPGSVAKYRHFSGYRYTPGATDMQGVLAILFQKI